MDLNRTVDSVTSLFEVDAADLASEDLVGAYEDAYTSAMVRIRAVGDVIARGKKPRNLNVAIESMRLGVQTMRSIHNKAGPLLRDESHWCCDRPRSEIMRGGVHVTDWTIALAAIGISAAGLTEGDNVDQTQSALRAISTLCVSGMHVLQGWFAGKTFEQIAYEEDLMRLMKGSAGRIRYVESMINTFNAWSALQEHSGLQAHELTQDVESLIQALEAVPIRAKTASDKCRRDVLEGFLATRMGERMLDASEKLQKYRKLVQEESKGGDPHFARTDQEAEESEDISLEDEVNPHLARSYLKRKKREASPMKHMRVGTLRARGRRADLQMDRRSSPQRTLRTDGEATIAAGVLDEFVQSRFCCFVSWSINRLVGKFESKYRIVEQEAASVGGALKKHDATEIDFETSIAALGEVLDPILTLERVAKHILASEKSIPTAANFRTQQTYRTILQLVFTGGSLAVSIAEAVIEYKEEEANETLKTIAFIGLILGQIGARWDNHLQGKIFSKMRDIQTLRGVLAKKHSSTIKALMRYWESCQIALTSGHDSDVDRAFAVRVPRPMMAACSTDDVAHHILDARKRQSRCLEMEDSVRSMDFAPRMMRVEEHDDGLPMSTMPAVHVEVVDEDPTPISDFDAKVMKLARQASLASHQRCVSKSGGLGSPGTKGGHDVAIVVDRGAELDPWDQVDSEEEDLIPEGNWEFRLRELEKLETQRRQRRAELPETELHLPAQLSEEDGLYQIERRATHDLESVEATRVHKHGALPVRFLDLEEDGGHQSGRKTFGKSMTSRV